MMASTQNDQAAREALIKRLNRIEGQVRGIRKMVEEKRECGDVLKQIAAVSGAVHGLAGTIIENHMAMCLAKAEDKAAREQTVAHLVDVFKTFMK